MLGFGPFCLDLGHIAWNWAIWQNLGQNRPQRRRSPEDGAGEGGRTYVRTDVRMYGRTDRFPLCSTGLRLLRGRCPASSHSNSRGGHSRPNPHLKMRAVSSQTTQGRIGLEWFQFSLPILTRVVSKSTPKRNLDSICITFFSFLYIFKIPSIFFQSLKIVRIDT